MCYQYICVRGQAKFRLYNYIDSTCCRICTQVISIASMKRGWGAFVLNDNCAPHAYDARDNGVDALTKRINGQRVCLKKGTYLNTATARRLPRCVSNQIYCIANHVIICVDIALGNGNAAVSTNFCEDANSYALRRQIRNSAAPHRV